MIFFSHKKLHNFIKFGICSPLIILGIFIIVIFILLDYSSFIQFILDNFPIATDKELKSLISETKYDLFKFAGIIPVIASGFIFLSLNKLTMFFKTVIEESVFKFKNTLFYHDKNITYILLGILITSIFIRFFFMYFMPINYDEAWTYLFFTRQGFLSSISFYPVPNNHVFHSLLTNITYYFPFEKTINLRLPNLLINLASIYLVFHILAKKFKPNLSLCLTFIYSLLFPVLYFGFNSRGYSLSIFAFILCSHCLEKLLISKDDPKDLMYHFYLSLGTVIGFYTIPAFLYPYISLVLFVSIYTFFHKKTKTFIRIAFNGIISGAIIISLYTPIFLVSGISSVTNNKFVEQFPRIDIINNLYYYFSEISLFLSGIPIWIILPLLFTIFICSIYYKKKDISLQFSLFCFAICPFIIIIHSVNPPPRIWSYLSFPLILLIGHSFSLLKIKKHITPLIFTFFYSVVLIHFSYNEINTREKLSFDSYKLFNLIKEKKYNSAFIYHPLIKTNLSYYFEKEDLPKFTFTHQDLISTDSLNRVKNYDIIISSVELLSDKDYILKEIFEEDLFLYKKREN